MGNFSDIIITRTPEELGEAARASRQKSGVSLRKSSKENSYGTRFLSEFERGKSTAELGKVMQALHAAGLDLAVVPRQVPRVNVERLSKQIELEFPYDWSNQDISESTLIFLVLEKARFNDILRISHHFGIDNITAIARQFTDKSHSALLHKYLQRIRKGMEFAGLSNVSP